MPFCCMQGRWIEEGEAEGHVEAASAGHIQRSAEDGLILTPRARRTVASVISPLLNITETEALAIP